MPASALTARSVNSESVLLRLVVYPGEVYRLPEAGQCLHVQAGRAWVTLQGQDVLLDAQECARLPVSAEAALLSAMGPAPLTVELSN